MSNADYESRESDSRILDALQGIETMLHDFKRNNFSGKFLLLHFYRRLPDDVARRLSEIDSETVELTAEWNQDVACSAINKLNDSAALEQIVRAENFYRQRLGYTLLDLDGLPEKGTLNNGDPVQM